MPQSKRKYRLGRGRSWSAGSQSETSRRPARTLPARRPWGCSPFVKNLNNRDVEKRTRWWVVSLAPGTAELVGKTIKVNGTMLAVPNTRNGTRAVSPTPARCDVRDGFIHPVYEDSPPEKVASSGTPMDPYDQFRPSRDQQTCRRAART